MQLKWRLSHARGYLELGMIAEAAAELDLVPPESANDIEVRLLRAVVLQEQKRWPALAETAASLVDEQPGNPSGWIMWAYAVRRSQSLPAAEKILLAAAKQHPEEATIQFNLGCYACQQGDMEKAQAYVKNAIALDDQFRSAAEKDPDLEPLRELGVTF
jgi:Tfp pilus assembly protein PilF